MQLQKELKFESETSSRMLIKIQDFEICNSAVYSWLYYKYSIKLVISAEISQLRAANLVDKDNNNNSNFRNNGVPKVLIMFSWNSVSSYDSQLWNDCTIIRQAQNKQRLDVNHFGTPGLPLRLDVRTSETKSKPPRYIKTRWFRKAALSGGFSFIWYLEAVSSIVYIASPCLLAHCAIIVVVT